MPADVMIVDWNDGGLLAEYLKHSEVQTRASVCFPDGPATACVGAGAAASRPESRSAHFLIFQLLSYLVGICRCEAELG